MQKSVTSGARSFNAVRSQLSVSDAMHGDLGDQAVSQTGPLEALIHLENVSRRNIVQKMEYEQKLMRGEQNINICTDCPDEIPEKRRLAMPFATRCCKCQEAFEQARRR